MCSTTSNSSPPLSNRISIKTTPCRRHTWCFGFNYIIMQTDAFHLHVFASYICKQRMSSGADSFCYTCRGATCSVLTHHYTIYSYAGDNDENFSLPISSFHYLGSKIQHFDLCSFVFFAFLVIKKKALSRNSQNFSKIWFEGLRLINCTNNLAPDECLFTCREQI